MKVNISKRIVSVFLAIVMCYSVGMSISSVAAIEPSDTADYPSERENADNNISVKKSAEWTDGYNAQIKISTSGIDEFEMKKLGSDVVFVLDNSNSMYTAECRNENHVICLPVDSDVIKNGAFAVGSTDAGKFVDPDLIGDDTWTTIVDDLYETMKKSSAWAVFGDFAESMSKTEAVDTYGPILLESEHEYQIDGLGYIKLKAGVMKKDKMATNPDNWLLYTSDDVLYNDDNIENGVFYSKLGYVINEFNGIISSDTWENNILPEIRSNFTPGMIIDVADGYAIIYSGTVNTEDTSYAENSEKVENPVNWTLIDTSKQYSADFMSDPAITGDMVAFFNWLGYALNYHFDISDGSLKRVGSVQSSGKFERVTVDAQEDGCVVNATILRDNIEQLIKSICSDDSDNNVAIVAFEDKVYETLDFTDSESEVTEFLDKMYSGPKTASTYNTNYEAAWVKTAEIMLNARKDSARYVVFVTDGYPTVCGFGDDIKQNDHQDENYLREYVNDSFIGIKSMYDAVVSTISVGIDIENYNKYVNGLATNGALAYKIENDSDFAEDLKKTMEATYESIYLWAQNVCVSDVIDYHFSIRDKEQFLNEHPGAVISEFVENGNTYTKVFVPVGDIKGNETTDIIIPIVLKDEYQNTDSSHYVETNDGLSVSYLDPKDKTDKTVEVENPYLPVYAFGSLTISKTVTGENIPEDDDFTFVVTFTDDGTYDGVESGSTITLKNGESKIISRIPEKVGYSVTEVEKDNYTAEMQSISGIISKDGSYAAFVNAYERPVGSLVINKTVIGDESPAEDEFIFTVTFSDGETYGGVESGSTITLKNGGTYTIDGIPDGVEYFVTESEKENYTAEKQTISGTMTKDGAIASFVNNYKTPDEPEEPELSSLTITKKVTGDPAPAGDVFGFVVSFSDGETYDGIESGSVIHLKDGESYTINEIPEGIGYSVSEMKAENYSSEDQSINGKIEKNGSIASFVNIYTTPDVEKPDEPESEPVSELPDEPTTKPDSESTTKPVSETTTKPVSETTTKPIAVTTTNSASETTTKSISETTTKPIAVTTTDFTSETTTKPISETTTKPIVTTTEPTAEITTKPNTETTTKQSTETTEPVGETTTHTDTVTTTEPTLETTTTAEKTTSANSENKKFVSLTVTKVWDDGNSANRPASVIVQLYCDGKEYGEEVTLSKDNKWTQTWTTLPEGHKWTVDETSTSQGYVKSVSHDGTKWTITNKLVNVVDTIPQTSDNRKTYTWIAISVLSAAGFIYCSVPSKRKKEVIE